MTNENVRRGLVAIVESAHDTLLRRKAQVWANAMTEPDARYLIGKEVDGSGRYDVYDGNGDCIERARPWGFHDRITGYTVYHDFDSMGREVTTLGLVTADGYEFLVPRGAHIQVTGEDDAEEEHRAMG